MAAIHTSIALGLIMVTLTGCGPSASRWVGEWRGEDKGLILQGEDETIKNTLRTVRLTIRADGSYDLLQGGMSSTGRIGFGDPTSTLTTLTIMGQPFARQSPELQAGFAPRQVRWNGNGSVTLLHPSALPDQEITLTVQEQPR